jgi:hypothetical protein
VISSLTQSRWFWPVAGVALSLLLMKLFPGNFFLFLPFLFLPMFGRKTVASVPVPARNNHAGSQNLNVTDEERSNVALISRLVERYNAQDAEGVAACFALDVQEFSHGGELIRTGSAAIAENYRKLFAEFPQNRADVLHRSAFGDKVIDHERVWRTPEQTPFDVVVVYTLKNGAVVRAEYVK